VGLRSPPLTSVSRSVDWESIEREYRAGLQSVRQIAKRAGITHRSVQKKAEKQGWVRDLGARIRQEADAKVAREAVANSVAARAEQVATECDIVTAESNVQVAIRLRQRTDIRSGIEIVQRMLAELGAQTVKADELEAWALLAAKDQSAGDEKALAKGVDAFLKMVNLPTRIAGIQKLAEALKTLIALERQAFGIEAGSDRPQSLGEFLDSLP